MRPGIALASSTVSSPARRVEHQVDAGEAVTAEQPVHGERQLLRRSGRDVAHVRRTPEIGASDLVARLEVVEVVVVRDRLDERERLGAVGPVDDGDREVAAGDVALEDHARVVGEGGDERARHVGRRGGELDPERGALAGGLDDDRELEPRLDRGQRLGRAELAERGLAERVEVGRRDPGVAHRVLGDDLVHAADAGGRARAGVGEADEVEQLLDRAVLAAAAVQRHERDVRARLLEPVDEVRADVDHVHVVAEPLQRVLDLRARAEGDLALERAAALEQRDAAHCARRRSGSTFGGSSGRRLDPRPAPSPAPRR